MVGMRVFIWRNREHLKEQSEIFDVVRVVVVVNGEPEHRMGVGILVSDDAGSSPGGNQNGRREGPGSLRRDQTQIVVPVDVFLLELVQIFDAVQSHLFHLLFDVFGEELGHVLWSRIVLLVGGNQVIGFLSEPLADAEPDGRGFLLVRLFVREPSRCGCAENGSLPATASGARDSETVGWK